MLLIALEYAILASTFTLAKVALQYCPPCFLIATRMLVAGFFLLALSAYYRVLSWPMVRRAWWPLLQVSLFHAYLAFIPEFWALQYLSSAKTSIIYALTPFLAALFAYLLQGAVLGWQKFAAMGIAVVGLLPLIGAHGSPASSMLQISVPEVVLLGAVASACYAWFVITDLMAAGFSLLVINGIAFFVGGLLSVPTFLVVEGAAWQQVTDWSAFVAWLSVLIVMAHGISYNLYGWLLMRYSIPFMTLCGFLCPLMSTFFGACFLGEQITWHYCVSLVGITAGLLLFAHADGVFDRK